MPLLYRVESLIVPQKGLWYNAKDGKSSNLVHDLDLSNRTLPMDYNDIIARENWKSAADSPVQLKYWFTHEDLRKLIPLGYNLFEIDASVTILNQTEHYTHPLFQEISVRSRKQLDINTLLK